MLSRDRKAQELYLKALLGKNYDPTYYEVREPMAKSSMAEPLRSATPIRKSATGGRNEG